MSTPIIPLQRVPKKMMGIDILRGKTSPTSPPTRKLDRTRTHPHKMKLLFQKPSLRERGTFDLAASPTTAFRFSSESANGFTIPFSHGLMMGRPTPGWIEKGHAMSVYTMAPDIIDPLELGSRCAKVPGRSQPAIFSATLILLHTPPQVPPSRWQR